jgi:hypothetical protein
MKMIKLFNLNCKLNKTNVILRLSRSMKPFELLVRKYYKKSLDEQLRLQKLDESNKLEANIEFEKNRKKKNMI